MTDSKGDRTRERIVSSAAPVFNRLGFAGASVADLMEAAGLEKGGIYRHFESKEAIALASFDHATRLQGERFRAYMAAAPRGAVAQLVALAEAMASVAEDPMVAGGCPLLNTAVESDDAEGEFYRELRARARREMSRLLGAVRRIIAEGIASRELAHSTNPDAEASAFVATMEGAIMLTKLYDDPIHLRHAITHVRERAESLAAGRSARRRSAVKHARDQ
jgi:TetR/AcrR family transcriptional regulator, transcriptional repressor for nem operon